MRFAIANNFCPLGRLLGATSAGEGKPSGYIPSILPVQRYSVGIWPRREWRQGTSLHSLRAAPTTAPGLAPNSCVSLHSASRTESHLHCFLSFAKLNLVSFALRCKIHIKPPGLVGQWPGGKIGYKLKDLSTAAFWKGKKQEEPSHNSLILVPCWKPPWTRSAKKRIKEKIWKWCNLASSLDYRLLLPSPWRPAEWFARYQAKTTVQQRAIPRDCFCWVAVFPCLLFKMLILWSM